MMTEKRSLRKLASDGFSVIPVNDDKTPLGSWKKHQTTPRTPDEVEQLNSPLYGLVAGVNDLEIIDIDLKVLTSLKERKEWFDEYMSFCDDNIEDFYKKFVIAKTRNAGYHILYRCSEITNNSKIAKLQGQKECILESRGRGGMVVMYNDFHTDLTYHDIQVISTEDREILWSISRTYNYVEPVPEIIKKSEHTDSDVTPWKDYNDKHTALDLINDDFSIVRTVSKSYIVKRHGAKSAHSGYVFKDSGCLYLFSTGTIYPAEQLLSPFAIYAHKYHNGDFTNASNELYKDGYGSRRVPKIPIPPIQPKIEKLKIEREQFPIDIFPDEVQRYILESERTLGLSIDYMACSFLWSLSVIIGNSIVVQVKPGWKETCTLWLAIVGKPGIGKTPSVRHIIEPLQTLNNREQKEYQRQSQRYSEFQELSKQEKDNAEIIDKPKNKQFIVGDVTLEALIEMHESNPNSIGIFKDELAGWFKDMNKYRQGSDLEFWLSSWSGSPISLNRKTAKSSFVDKPFIPVLGGIQPSIFEDFSNGANKENGFIDRILISYPALVVDNYSDGFMSIEAMEWYSSFMISFKEKMYKLFVKFDEHGNQQPTVATFLTSAQEEWVRIFNDITAIQNGDEENEYMKSMLPKQKSYIPRFALLLNTIHSYFSEDYSHAHINKTSMLRAEKLSKYFVNMAKLVKIDAREKIELKRVSQNGSTSFDKFKMMYLSDKEINRTTASELLEVSRRTIQRWATEIDKHDKIK